jgi:hypothetical protein
MKRLILLLLGFVVVGSTTTGARAQSREEVFAILEAAPVTVAADVEAMYFKYLKKRGSSGFFDHTLTAPFSWKIKESGGRERTIAGTFTAGNGGTLRDTLNGITKDWFYYYRPLEIQTSSDTTGMDRELRHHIHLELEEHFCRTINSINSASVNSPFTEQSTRFGYLGKQDSCRLFRLTIYMNANKQNALQKSVWLDEQSGLVRKFESRNYHASQSTYESVVTCTLQTIRGNVWIDKKYIFSDFKHSRTDGERQWTFEMSNPVIKRKKWQDE